ncbi:MAG: hypothetical protein Q8S43_04850 [Actinomycetota bacterium]|nr:MAG: hypothetical protein FD171_217 [Actinomycetota bacterium]MDO8949465.1 hypothetical protein [Actinomycetota bacterium]MDP3630267.1 hypothetical protein [Actinomycetota bacterium]
MVQSVGVKSTGEAQPGTRWWRRLGIGLVVITLVAGGAFGYIALDRTRVARRHIDEAARLLSEAEPSVIAVDAAVRSEITTALVVTAAKARISASDAHLLLTRAREELDLAGPALAEADRPLAVALRTSVDARATMMTEGAVILQVDERAAAVLEQARTAWILASGAETLTVDAVAQYNKHTKAGVEQSTVLSKQAAMTYTTARSLLEPVTARMPEADMTPFRAYLDARLKLIVQSQAIDATWLAGKVADANMLLDAYNADEAKVVKLAEALPGTPVSALATVYDELTKAGMGRYFEARDAARGADLLVKAAATAR